MSDTVEITLPVSKKVVVIRNYTTRADDEKAESVLYTGVNANQKVSADGSVKDNDQVLSFPIANVMAAQQCYVPRLVKSIDGDTTNIKLQIDELRTEDYQAIETAVSEIVETHSPKAKAAKAA